jgi:hypothetical protein
MNWRALLAGGVFVALLISAVLIARPGGPEEEVIALPVAKPTSPVIAAPAPPLTRADLIDAAARAADAHARGVPLLAEDSELAGRRFTLRLPFGCVVPAEADSEASMGWSYEPEEQTLRVLVAPNVWTDAGPVRKAAKGLDYEAAEGFWIERPWLRTGDCPVWPQPSLVASATSETVKGNQVVAVTSPEAEQAVEGVPAPALQLDEAQRTLALVEYFKPGSRRAARRNGKPYTVVAKLAPSEIDLTRGLRVVVTGRLVPFGSRSAIACSGIDVDKRPLCLISAEIDRVAITDASGQRTLGEWEL